MKKLFSFLLFLAVVACLLLLPTEAHAASVNDLSYTIDGGEVTITGCNTSAAGELVIPETIEGYPVTNIDHRAFKNCVNLTSVTIPDSVTSIGYEAFMSCIGLTSLTIPGSVASFDGYAFAFCESLTSVKIENGVTNIVCGMFEYCNNLTNITIPDSVTSIGEYAFEECTNLTSVTIPDSVTSIGEKAFWRCNALKYVLFTGSLEQWEQVTIGTGNNRLAQTPRHYHATADCSIVAETGCQISRVSCTACEDLIRITSQNGSHSYQNGVCQICGTEEGWKYSVKIEGNSATVTITGYNGPGGAVTIPKTIEGAPVTSIGEHAFEECTSLTSIIIPDSVTSIGSSAFEDCSSLTRINIPAGVTSIGGFAFYNCSNLANVYITDVEAWLNISFGNDCAHPNYYGNLHIMDEHGVELTELIVPAGVTSIGGFAFYNCSSLTSINIPDSVTSIGHFAFYGCERLTSITIPNSVTSIGEKAFYNCSSLTSINIPDSITYIGSSAFEGCRRLTGVYISDIAAWCNIALGSDEANPLVYAKKLYLNGSLVTDLVIPDGVTSIGNSAFYNCSSLTSVTIGKKMDKIGEDAFSNCTKLQHVLCLGSQEDWDWIIIKSGNENLTNATRHYNCTGNEITENGCTICLANCQHSWNSGVVTKKSTCKEEGVKTYTCSICNGTKTETIAKLTTHTYDNACDTSCNICAQTRTVPHSYGALWSADKTNHWHECSVCHDKKDLAVHIPGAAATETTAQTCTICAHVIKDALGHTHSFGNTWLTDDTNHWRVCACGEKADEAAHTWDGAACSVCGTQNPTPPTEPGTEPPTEPATEPSTEPELPTTGTPTQPDPTVPADDNQEDGGFPIWIPIVVAVLGGGIAVVVIILKKKR